MDYFWFRSGPWHSLCKVIALRLGVWPNDPGDDFTVVADGEQQRAEQCLFSCGSGLGGPAVHSWFAAGVGGRSRVQAIIEPGYGVVIIRIIIVGGVIVVALGAFVGLG